MSESNNIIYFDLPLEIRNSIQERLKQNKNLQIGFFSQDYNFELNGKKIFYRFHAREEKGQKTFTIKFGSDLKNHNPYSKNNNLFFYDSTLKTTLHIKKSLFEEILEKEIDFNLSTEQKELLANGHDITLNVTSNSKEKNNVSKIVSKKELKNFVADYTFFLGKCSLLIKETCKNTVNKSLSLTKNN